MSYEMKPLTTIYFWVFCNSPGSVYIGTKAQWDLWQTWPEFTGADPCVLHEAMVLNFQDDRADWSWWPMDHDFISPLELTQPSEDTGPWPVSPSFDSQAIAKAIRCPYL